MRSFEFSRLLWKKDYLLSSVGYYDRKIRNITQFHQKKLTEWVKCFT